MKVLNFGSLNVDYVYQMDHMVLPGETQLSSGMEIFYGGKGFNQSVALAKAGVNVYHAGMIGEDGLGFLDKCKEYGIRSEYIKTIEGKSGHTIIQVDKTGQNCIILYGGSNQALTKEFIDSVFVNFNEGDFLVLQNEVNMLDYIIDTAYDKGMKIVLNPSPYNEKLDACDMGKITYFLLNEIEGEQLTGEKDPEKILDIILKKYPDAKVVLTLGGDGSIYADKDRICHQGICKVEVVDTTAAGDTFTGYFIAGEMQGADVKDTLEIAAKASAIAVSRKGASPSIPWRKEITK